MIGNWELGIRDWGRHAPVTSYHAPGPGAITTVMLTMERLTFPDNYLVVVVSVCVSLAAVWGILLGIKYLNRLLGRRGALILSKLMGIVLTAIATSFILRGILSLSSRSPT